MSAAGLERGGSLLRGLLLLYLAASFLHFAHNAEYLSAYPNLPAWLTRSYVYLAWSCVATLGTAGYALYRLGWRLAGLFLVGVDATLGFDGLLHYTRAPLAGHTAAMNFTIGFEVTAAGLLLAVVARLAANRVRDLRQAAT